MCVCKDISKYVFAGKISVRKSLVLKETVHLVKLPVAKLRLSSTLILDKKPHTTK